MAEEDQIEVEAKILLKVHIVVYDSQPADVTYEWDEEIGPSARIAKRASRAITRGYGKNKMQFFEGLPDRSVDDATDESDEPLDNMKE